MKLKLNIIFLLLAVLAVFSNPLRAESTSGRGAKIYLKAEQISLYDECIAIKLPEGVFGTMYLAKDTTGYYVFANDLLRDKVEAWRCFTCGFLTTSGQRLNEHLRQTGHRQ